MGETVRWSPALLYRELPGPPGVTRFRYPARLEALGYLLLACGLFLFALLIAVAITEPGWQRGFGVALAALFFLPLACVAVHRLWTIRILEVDPDRREISLVRRTPLRRSRDALEFDELRQVSLVEEADIEPDPSHRTCCVHVEVRGGARIRLGCAPRRRARDFARRLSALTGLPLSIPPPGPWGLREEDGRVY